jgi:acyl carrier protein phosphodiesterase
MNFLAHAYLSFNHPQILVGNMISDFVKGSSRLGFSGNINKGITLHRDIDEFTDNHEATAKAKNLFRPAYRLYSGPIMDVLYDHFLANDPNEFTESTLEQFSLSVYQTLEMQSAVLPPNFLHAFGYMKTHNWLYNYRLRAGIKRSLDGLVRRATYMHESETAFNIFNEQYQELNECYQKFLPDVKQFAKQRFEELVL